jgi:hypothetical protein
MRAKKVKGSRKQKEPLGLTYEQRVTMNRRALWLCAQVVMHRCEMEEPSLRSLGGCTCAGKPVETGTSITTNVKDHRP